MRFSSWIAGKTNLLSAIEAELILALVAPHCAGLGVLALEGVTTPDRVRAPAHLRVLVDGLGLWVRK